MMKRKVLAYITREDRSELLVFRHRDFPEAGVQVPGGTVDPGEDLEIALLREIAEESGLTNRFKRVRYLTSELLYHGARGEWHERHVFHLVSRDPLPEEWSHTVTAGEEDGGLVFTYSWMDLERARKALARGQGKWATLLAARAIPSRFGAAAGERGLLVDGAR